MQPITYIGEVVNNPRLHRLCTVKASIIILLKEHNNKLNINDILL